MTDAVRAALSRFEYVLKQEGFTPDLRIDTEPLAVHADPDALGQAVLNLLSHAVKYSGQSRVIRVSVEHRGDSGVVAVADEGIGIPAAVRGRIFESFYRVPDAAADTAGAGLGLGLVRHFAEAHGGRVPVPHEASGSTPITVVLNWPATLRR